jgi:hypothetical protein
MRRCAALLILMLALPAGGATWYLPGAAEAIGANESRFSSTLFVTNPGPAPVRATFNYVPYPGGRAARFPVAMTLAAGETVRVVKVLETLFELTADAGTLTIDAESPLLMYMTTSNVANPLGTYGLAIEATPFSGLLTGGAVLGHVIWASHNGENFTLGYRTNVGGVLTDPNGELQIRVYDHQSVLRGSHTVSSTIPASFQLSLNDIIGPTNLPLGRIELDVRQGRAAVYVSVIDNLTSDGIALAPQPVSSATTQWIINGAARALGANNTRWATDVRLFNPSFNPTPVSVNSVGFPRTATYSLEVPGRSIVELADIVGPGGLNFNEAAGAVRLNSTLPLMAIARSSNSDPTGALPGTFTGLQMPVPHPGGYLRSGDRVSLIGLENSVRFRTNVGCLGGPEDGGVAMLTLRDRLGNVAATRQLELQNGQWSQSVLNALFPNSAVPELSRVDITVDSGRIDCYASKIDNGTGDPVVIRPLPLP